jgi:hypothetical protein
MLTNLSEVHQKYINNSGLSGRYILSTNQVELCYGLTPRLVRKLVKERILKPGKTKTGTWFSFPRRDIETYLKSTDAPPEIERLEIAKLAIQKKIDQQNRSRYRRVSNF